MTTPYTPHGFQSGPPQWVGSLGQPAPTDIAGIKASIDRAVSSLRANERGSLTVQVDQSGAGAGLVVRFGPGTILGTVTKPKAGAVGWSLQGRVGFLFGQPAMEPVWLLPELRGLVRLFREHGNGRVAALVKAVAVQIGREVRLTGDQA